MLNMRMSDGTSYNPARDIVNLFGPVAEHAIAKLHPTRWHEAIRDYAEKTNLDPKLMADGIDALRKFVFEASAFPSTQVGVPWTNSGLADLPKPVLIAIVSQIGMGMMAAFYNAVQNSVRMGQNAPGAAVLAAQADEVAAAIKQCESPRAADRRIKRARARGTQTPDLS